MAMLFFRKLFKLPGPVELGRSDYNSLQMRQFSPDCVGYTWEDWHVEVKALHPIKYWFAETAANFIRYKIWFPIKRPLENVRYWLVSHLILNRRYHMLDLRQPGGYQYGWQDVPEKLLYANFNLLKEYLDEKPYDLTTHYTLEQINADPEYKQQHDTLQEAKNIFEWWSIKRIGEQKIYDDLLTRWSTLNKNKAARDNGEAKQMWAVMQATENDLEKKTDEMLSRLMKIRRSLWT